jgi:hypothetical protein
MTDTFCMEGLTSDDLFSDPETAKEVLPGLSII